MSGTALHDATVHELQTMRAEVQQSALAVLLLQTAMSLDVVTHPQMLREYRLTLQELRELNRLAPQASDPVDDAEARVAAARAALRAAPKSA